MTKYVLKRISVSCIVFIVVMFVIYAVMYMLPESYAEAAAKEMCRLPNNTLSEQEWQLRIETECGLDKNVFIGYISWLYNMFRGEFGTSWYYGMNVTEKFYSVIGNSICICLTAFICELVIAIPVGIISAKRKDKLFDKINSVLCIVFMSIPVFFIAALLKYLFAVKFGVFELGGMRDNLYLGMNGIERFADRLSHLVLPIATLVIAGSGALVRYIRINVNSVLESRYVKGAKARGLSYGRVTTNHALRNSLVPIINILCSSIPAVFAGSMIIETIFSIEGIGYVSYIAMLKGDIPFTMFYMMIIAVITILSTFIADIACAAVDYRVRNGFYGGAKQ